MSWEKIDEIQEIKKKLREEFPEIVLKQIDRVQQEVDMLRNRVEGLIKLFKNSG
tara:strand:+ start:110 stop:271 length:162 start_codon:yes stop_codon:yes gene_type:complete